LRQTLWTILIKILGLWLVLNSLTIIPQFISTIFYTYSNDVGIGLAVSFALLFLTIGAYLFILRLFVFKTAWLIEKLHLVKGFDEEKIDLNIQRSTVLTVASIVVGGLLFVESLPQFCRQIFVFYQQKYLFHESPTSAWMIFHLVKIVLGYLLMTNSKQVVAFINKETTKQIDHDA
jgi:hypothetical protein